MPAAVLAGFAALPAAATTLRVDVAGTLGWSYVYAFSVDSATGDLHPGGILTPGDVPPGTPGFEHRDLAEATTGRFFYSTQDGAFSGCTGLMTMVCRFSLDGPDVNPNPPVAFDTARDVFTAALAILPDVATFEIGPQSFLYGTDFAFPDPVIGTRTYFQAFPLFEGSIDSMTVTIVPLPASLPMLLAGLGALALQRRRALRPPRPHRTRRGPSA